MAATAEKTTAVAEKPSGSPAAAWAAADLATLLGETAQPVKDVLALLPDPLVLAKAWTSGDVEFGKAKHCVSGRPGNPESMPTLLIEDGTEWTGPKTPRHLGFSALYADAQKVPDYRVYKRYVRAADKDGEPVWDAKIISREEAVPLLALLVRLTDKGLAAAQTP